FYQVLRELFARALEVIALYVGYVFAIFVGFNQQEALGIFWVAVPLEFQAARLSVAGFGVPVDLIEESVSVFGLDMEFNVNENHGAHDTERILMRIPRRVASNLYRFSGTTLSKIWVSSSSCLCGVKAGASAASCSDSSFLLRFCFCFCGANPGQTQMSAAAITAAAAAPMTFWPSGTKNNANATTVVMTIQHPNIQAVWLTEYSAHFCCGKRLRASLRTRRGVFMLAPMTEKSTRARPEPAIMRSPMAPPKAR